MPAPQTVKHHPVEHDYDDQDTRRLPSEHQKTIQTPPRAARRPTGHQFFLQAPRSFLASTGAFRTHETSDSPLSVQDHGWSRISPEFVFSPRCKHFQVAFFAANHASRGPVAARTTHGTTQQTRCEQRTSCVQVVYVVYSVHNETQRPDLHRGLQIMGRGEHLNQHPLYFQGKNPMVYHTAWGPRLLVQPFCFLPFPHCSLLGREA